jgi:MarR family transcriptional regulator, organic hydroperoxide resistance regulator
MDKKQTIEKIIEAQHHLTHNMVPNIMESWRKLDVPLAQLKSLFIIVTQGEINFRNLAQELDVTPANVTGIIDRLVEQGLVARNPSPEDHRVIRLQATDQGRALMADLVENHIHHLVQALERMSTTDLTALLRGLAALVKALQQSQREIVQSHQDD